MSIRRRPKHADRGASLLIVLGIITVVSLVMGVIITQVGNAENSTVQLRDQASDNYGADAATNAVLSGLQHSGLNCTDPSNPTPVTLGIGGGAPFYKPAQTQEGPIDAYAQCTPDAITGTSQSVSQPPTVTSTTVSQPPPVVSTGTVLGGGNTTLPSYAVLTTGSSSGDFGFDISPAANNKTLCVQNGSVGSNKDINATGQLLAVRIDPAVTGLGSASDCTTGAGTDPNSGSSVVINAQGLCKGGTSVFKPTPCTPSKPSIATPPAPTLAGGPLPLNPAPTCSTVSSTTYAAFVPGVYTTGATLSSPCGGGSKIWEWLSPGTYFFNFTGTNVWTFPTTVVGGTPVNSAGTAIPGLNASNASTLAGLATTAPAPNACADPASGGNTTGVSLVFGGASTVLANPKTVTQFCATTPASTTSPPPVAVDGLTSGATVSLTGGGTATIPAESLCSATGCGSNTLIATTTDNSSAQAQLYIKGYVYAPQAQIEMTMKNSVGQVFDWGIVVRNLQLTINGSSPTAPFIQLPKPNTGIAPVVTTSTPPPTTVATTVTPAPITTTTYSIRYINVWTCLASKLAAGQACSHSGTPNLQVRVLTNGATMNILSWSHIR